MRNVLLRPGWASDLPVCFPDRPCLDYSPYEADAINITSGLTAVSQTIAIGCFAALGVAVALLVLGLRSRRYRVGLAVVALSAALIVGGLAIAIVVDLRLGAIASIYGPEGAGGPNLFGSWDLVGLVGEAMTAAGIVGLVAAATVAIVRLQNATSPARASTARRESIREPAAPVERSN